MLTEDPKPVKSVCDFIYHWLLTDIQRHETHIVHTFDCYITNTWRAFKCELSLKDTSRTLVQYSFGPWSMYIQWSTKVWPAYNWPLSDIPPSFEWYSTKYLTNMHVPSTQTLYLWYLNSADAWLSGCRQLQQRQQQQQQQQALFPLVSQKYFTNLYVNRVIGLSTWNN